MTPNIINANFSTSAYSPSIDIKDKAMIWLAKYLLYYIWYHSNKYHFLYYVDPKNWNLNFFYFFCYTSYDPGPTTSLLYFLPYLCLAFPSWFVSKIIWSKNDRTLFELNADEGCLCKSLPSLSLGNSYDPGPTLLAGSYFSTIRD